MFINGINFDGITWSLQMGHSGFTSADSWIQVQQKTCPHNVEVGWILGSKHNGHFLPLVSVVLLQVLVEDNVAMSSWILLEAIKVLDSFW